jgi:hypothetical protein
VRLARFARWTPFGFPLGFARGFGKNGQARRGRLSPHGLWWCRRNQDSSLRSE